MGNQISVRLDKLDIQPPEAKEVHYHLYRTNGKPITAIVQRCLRALLSEATAKHGSTFKFRIIGFDAAYNEDDNRLLVTLSMELDRRSKKRFCRLIEKVIKMTEPRSTPDTYSCIA